MKKYLNSKIKIASFVILTLVLTMVFVNYAGANKQLPIVDCTTTYPSFMISELVSESKHIVRAQVTGVGDTIMIPVYVSFGEDPDTGSDETLYYPVTPIYLKVMDSMKGEVGEEFVYYEEGGTTSTYIQLPQGYRMNKNMNVILFLNEEGYGWGAQSIYPVIDDKVIINSSIIEELDGVELSSMSVSSVPDHYRRQLSDSIVTICDLGDFVNTISSYVE